MRRNKIMRPHRDGYSVLIGMLILAVLIACSS